jgi:hypothetical protein
LSGQTLPDAGQDGDPEQTRLRHGGPLLHGELGDLRALNADAGHQSLLVEDFLIASSTE